MDNKVIIIIILVLVVGLLGGYVIGTSVNQVHNDQNLINSTSNQNNSSLNSSSNKTLNKTNNTSKTTKKESSSERPIISANKAMSIASYALRGYEVKGKGAELTTGKNGKPIWIVYIFNPDGSSAGSCAVDASTGEFLGY